jgi:hypothetical protein
MTRGSTSHWCVVILGILLSSVVWAYAASKSDYPLSLKVLSAKTDSVPVNAENNDVPTDCNPMDYSAYCHSSRKNVVRNTMLVQDGSGRSFTISCMVESRWSNCISLPVGETFGAEKETHGFTVWYQNSKGKEVKQSYALVSVVDKASVAAAGSQKPAVPVRASSSSPPADSATGAPEAMRETVKCNFTSTPSGAEITLDGRYVGSTPSVVGVTTGTHIVALSLPGFDRW